jgi:hypothetical protein
MLWMFSFHLEFFPVVKFFEMLRKKYFFFFFFFFQND